MYRHAASEAGRDPATLPVSINSHGFIADTTQEATSLALPPYLDVMGRIARERGWPPPSEAQFEADRSRRHPLIVGSPQEVIDKILMEYELFGNDRFLMQMSVGTLPHDRVMRSIELFGTVVAPAVRKEVVAVAN